MRHVLGWLILILWTTAASTFAADDSRPRRFRVTGKDAIRRDVPVSAMLESPPRQPEQWRLLEVRSSGDVEIPWQQDSVSPRRIWWLACGETKPGGIREFRWELAAEPRTVQPCAGRMVRVDKEPDFIEARLGDAQVLRYNIAHVPPPPGLDAIYGRSAHIHPVWSPGGRIVTEQFPADHAHQSGVFLAHTKSRFEGRELNFWDLLGKKARVRHKSVRSVAQGAVFGEFVVEHEHVDLTVPNGKVAALEEWRVRVWNVGGAADRCWVWDIASSLRCATESPLELLKYHYGGMAIRGAASWGGTHAVFTTADGLGRVPGNHTRPVWCDLSGPVDGERVGVSLLTHPANFRYPEPIRIHPTMPYMVYAPSHLGDWVLKPGTPHVSRYRFVVHDGDLARDMIEHWQFDFANPLVAVE